MTDQQSPILNSPYNPPRWHYSTDDKGHLNYDDIRKDRRTFDPFANALASATAKQKQGSMFDANDLAEPDKLLVNLLRREIETWRKSEYPNTTGTTRELLRYWFLNPDRAANRSLFFAQREAIETAIWLNEVAATSNIGSHLKNLLKSAQTVSQNPDDNLPRICFKMATGTGKTVVMAALILYHYFNRRIYPNDTRFADNFLLVAPGITIKDRLGVLFVDNSTRDKNRAKDYYRERDLVPPRFETFLEGVNQRIVLTNYHAFEPKTLSGNKKGVFDGKFGRDKKDAKEDIGLTLKRLLGKFRPGSRLLILNDEAHHCYLPKEKEKNLKQADDDNAKQENERAAVWFSGVREIAKKWQLAAMYDLSATPYFLSGSGYPAYSFFPWVVSDFSLIEAIESGLVKIPFMPETDDTQNLKPILRDLFEHVKDDLPKKGQEKAKSEAKKAGIKLVEERPNLPVDVKNALEQFTKHYENYEAGLRAVGEKGKEIFEQPPVFIAVCNNTTVSKELYKYIAGYEYLDIDDLTVIELGTFDIFNNYESLGGKIQLKKRPPTLLIDSDALEDSNQVNDDFKKIFAAEIARFKTEYRLRHLDRSVENLTDGDILREVVNTVGKPGALGSHIRCVVSVSMLTEGWDANTVTHIMGLRKFGSQLLCEQVAGRALRRREYQPEHWLETVGSDGQPTWKKVKPADLHKANPENIVLKYPPEYAHIIGVPFKLFKGGTTTPPEPVETFHVKALLERQQEHEIIWPVVKGYRIAVDIEKLGFDFSKVPNYELDFSKTPRKTIMGSPVTAEKEELTTEEILEMRDQEIMYRISSELIRHKFNDEEKGKRFHLFNQILPIVEFWYFKKIVVIGEQDLRFRKAIIWHDSKAVAESIYAGIVDEQNRREQTNFLPDIAYYNPISSTKYISHRTPKPVLEVQKSHLNYATADAISKNPEANFWEHVAAKALDEMPEVLTFFKTDFSDFNIPYVADGIERLYRPDFVAKICLDGFDENVLLIIEITGANKEFKDIKKRYASEYWCPAVNSIRHEHPEWTQGIWAFLEISYDLRDFKMLVLEAAKNALYPTG